MHMHKVTKWIIDLNKRAETIKVLGKKTGKDIYDFELGNCFLNVTLNSQGQKSR